MGESRRRRRAFAVLSIESDDLDRLGQADEAWFRRFPARDYRLRHAGCAEIEALRRVHGPEAARVEPGERMFVALRRVFDGGFLKSFVPNHADAEVDVPEVLARLVYERSTRGQAEPHVMEAAMRRMVGEGHP